MTRRPSARGFTLVEVMISGSLFVVFATAVTSTWSTTSKLIAHQDHAEWAVNLMDTYAEEIAVWPKSAPHLAPTPTDSGDPLYSGYPRYFVFDANARALIETTQASCLSASCYTEYLRVKADDPVVGVKRLDISVVWSDLGATSSTSLFTYRE